MTQTVWSIVLAVLPALEERHVKEGRIGVDKLKDVVLDGETVLVLTLSSRVLCKV